MTFAPTHLQPEPPDGASSPGLPGLGVAVAGLRVARRMALALGLPAAVLAAGVAAALWQPGPLWLREAMRGGMLPLGLASLLIALSGLSGTLAVAWARRRASLAPVPMPVAPRWRAWLRPGGFGDALLIGRMARIPQAVLAVPVAVLAGLCAWYLRPMGGPVLSADLCFGLGGAMIVLGFPLLVAERQMAAASEAELPEAAGLRSLLLLPALVWPLLGALEIAAGLGAPLTGQIGRALALALVLVAAELAVRAVLRLFLPPPAPDAARGAVTSALASALAAGARGQGGLAAPIREHLGIDFARSWALAYVRQALPVVALLLLVFCWALSGVVMVGTDRRAIYERFGAPVAVLMPGAHLILPWPMGTLRWLDYGTLHQEPLGLADAAALPEATVAAEAVPPPAADRLWLQAHPSEVMLLLASQSTSQSAPQQGFQAVSLDVRVVWRAGMTGEGALRFAYRAADPQALVRGAAGRAAAGFFAARTLTDVLGENRAVMAEHLRHATQQALDGFDSGIEVVAVVIEAIHPPAGAADAYHAVQAAEIASQSSISDERGRAEGVRAASRQTANDQINAARAVAAETVGLARAESIRFTADRSAAQAGGEAFMLERYFTALGGALAKAHLTILDHRIEAADAPVLDIRPPAAAPASTGGGE